MSSSTKPESFAFETEFAENGEVLKDGANSYKRYRQHEVDELCQAAHDAALKSVKAETERRIGASAEAIVQHLQPVLPFAVQLSESLRRQSADLALLMARQLAGAAIDHIPEAAIEDSLQEVLSELPGGLSLVLSVQPDIAGKIEEAVTSRLPRGTELVVEADASVTPGSWRLSWESGSFAHNPEELTEKLQTILSNHLNKPVDEQDDLFAGLG